MRGADAAGFRFDPGWLATPRFAVLTPCDLGGLLALWCAAWADGGAVPADERHLAVLSRLGVSWEASGLRGALTRFFRKEAGRLVALDLEDQVARRESISAKRQAAGKASGEARRTSVEQVLNKCSTSVPAAPPPGDDEAPTAPPKRRRKERSSVQLDAPDAAPGEEAAGTPDCTSDPTRMPPKAGCAQSPHRERTLDSSSLSQGGRGGTQLDLFGHPVPPPANKSSSGRGKAAASKDLIAEAEALIDVYVEAVGDAHPKGNAAKNLVRWLTADGYTIGQMAAAVANYAEHMDGLGTEPRFRKAPSNFFGVQGESRGYFKDFLEKRTARPPGGGRQGGDVGGGARVRDRSVSYDFAIKCDTTVPDGPPAAAGPQAEGGAEHGQNPFLAP